MALTTKHKIKCIAERRQQGGCNLYRNTWEYISDAVCIAANTYILVVQNKRERVYNAL